MICCCPSAAGGRRAAPAAFTGDGRAAPRNHKPGRPVPSLHPDLTPKCKYQCDRVHWLGKRDDGSSLWEPRPDPANPHPHRPSAGAPRVLAQPGFVCNLFYDVLRAEGKFAVNFLDSTKWERELANEVRSVGPGWVSRSIRLLTNIYRTTNRPDPTRHRAGPQPPPPNPLEPPPAHPFPPNQLSGLIAASRLERTGRASPSPSPGEPPRHLRRSSHLWSDPEPTPKKERQEQPRGQRQRRGAAGSEEEEQEEQEEEQGDGQTLHGTAAAAAAASKARAAEPQSRAAGATPPKPSAGRLLRSVLGAGPGSPNAGRGSSPSAAGGLKVAVPRRSPAAVATAVASPSSNTRAGRAAAATASPRAAVAAAGGAASPARQSALGQKGAGADGSRAATAGGKDKGGEDGPKLKRIRRVDGGD
jgi:hypothetical protein